ncbi:MAG: HEPN domain-containing protein [Anaerolineae bacterium]|nr:HEPN domain-containing protein [Anaerolineae bacterium]
MDERERLAREWFDRDDNDFRSAQYLLTMPNPPYENIGFHAQQCAEKYLKGFLLYHGIRFEWRHDLSYLIDLSLAVTNRLAQFREDSDLLTPYAVEFRYPDTPAELSREECEQALRIADVIRQAVLEELGWFEKR